MLRPRLRDGHPFGRTNDRDGACHMVSGSVRIWLQLEGAAFLLLCCLLYAREHGRWSIFLTAFFLPDLAMLGYLVNRRIGAAAYNIAHTYLLPVLLVAISFGRSHTGLLTALIWISHIGFDRMLGYGLKYSTAFRDTHLGAVGNSAKHV